EADREVALRLQELMLRRESFRDVDYCRRGPTGDHWLRVSGKPFFDEAGRFLGYRGTGRDITELVHAEAARREAEERYRRLVEVCPIGLFVHRDGTICYANPAAAAILGAATPDALLGRPALGLVDERDRPRIEARARTLLARGGATPPLEIALRRLDGTTVQVETMGAAITDAGRPAIQVVLRDITTQKRLEDRLRDAEQRYRTVFELSPVSIFVKDRDHRILVANRATAELFGVADAEALVGRHAFDFLAAESRAVVQARTERMLATGAPVPVVRLQVVRADGETRYVEAAATPIEDKGEVRILVVQRDVTDRERAEAALREAEERYRTLVELAPVGILVYRDGAYGFVNREAARILGAQDPTSLVGVDPFELILEPYRDRIRARAAHLLAGGGPAPPVQIEMRRLDGKPVTVETVSAAVRDAGRPAVQIVLRDVTEEQRARHALEEAEARWRSLVELSPEAVMLIRDGRFVFANRRAAELVGASDPQELVGRAPADFVLDEFQAIIEERAQRLLREGGRLPPVEIKIRRLDGRILDVEASAVSVLDGGLPTIQSVVRDITDRKALEAELWRRAHHDPLTGLPNRLLFFDRLGRLLALAEREHRRGALLLLDLDGFKAVNDAHGHDAGDALLRAVARRLQRVTRRSDTVARLAGDEFALLLYPVADPAVVERIAERIVRALSAPVRHRGRVLRTGTSIGAALFPDDAADAEVLVKNADLALYRAKASGRGGIAFVDLPMRLELEQRRSDAQALRLALERGELALRWQPRVELASGRWPVLEAVPIWPTAPGGPREAERLIGLAEDAGVAFELAIRVTGLALETLAGWEAAGLAPARVALELTGAQLAVDDLVGRVLAELQARGLEPGRLELQVAERELLGRHGEAAERALAALRAAGVVVAINRFGEGSMPLRLLLGGRVDAVLLATDRVRAAVDDGQAALLVGAIAELGRGLGIEVGASGIESEQEAASLAALGCRYGRGPLWGPAMSAEQIAAALRARSAPPCACALSSGPILPRSSGEQRPLPY
ncbi:MAG: PAS domain S-box protein, partial [Geminicoccaceae bacterium]|nr:PAS domain S-box protein [Geminicoccaceae bacterium]